MLPEHYRVISHDIKKSRPVKGRDLSTLTTCYTIHAKAFCSWFHMFSLNGGYRQNLLLKNTVHYCKCSISVCSSEVMFTDLLLVPDHTCPGSLLRSKISYCLRHSHLVCTSSNYTIKTEFVKKIFIFEAIWCCEQQYL